MARFRNKKKVAFVKPAKNQPQQNVDHVTGDKIPRSFVFSRLKLPATLKQLQADLRKVMLPYTALNLKEKNARQLGDFLLVGVYTDQTVRTLESPKNITTTSVAERIKANHKIYQKRNAKKEASEKKYYEERKYISGD